MSAAIAITRKDHDTAELRRRVLRVRDPDQARRMLAIAMVLEGASRLDAARQAGMDRQTLRDWVLRYNAGGIGALASRKPPGSAPKLTQAEMDELRELVVKGPDPKVHKVIRWRCLDLRAVSIRAGPRSLFRRPVRLAAFPEPASSSMAAAHATAKPDGQRSWPGHRPARPVDRHH